eukprot:6349848-Prymnesium_polylepis.1
MDERAREWQSRAAIVTTLATTPPWSRRDPKLPNLPLSVAAALGEAPLNNFQVSYSGDDSEHYMSGAVALGKSLDSVDSRLDRLAITAYLKPSQRARLRAVGWCVLNAGVRRVGSRSLGIDMEAFHRPLYSAEQAKREHRFWPIPPPQARRDGSLTLFKFLAWALTRYERLLHVDCDVVVLESPDHLLTYNPPFFAATAERRVVRTLDWRSTP